MPTAKLCSARISRASSRQRNCTRASGARHGFGRASRRTSRRTLAPSWSCTPDTPPNGDHRFNLSKVVGSGDNRHELKRLTVDLGLRREPSQRVTLTLDLVPMNATIHYGKIDPRHALAHPQLFDETNVSFRQHEDVAFPCAEPGGYLCHALSKHYPNSCGPGRCRGRFRSANRLSAPCPFASRRRVQVLSGICL